MTNGAQSPKEELMEALSESMFVVFPLLILAFIVFGWKSTKSNFYGSEEITFAATILMGQTVVKYARSGDSSRSRKGLVITLIILFGLVPSLVVNAMVLSFYPAPLPSFLIWAGWVLFGISFPAFLSSPWFPLNTAINKILRLEP